MDPLTHLLLGGSVGYAAFGRKLGAHAAGLGMLAGVLPDVDSVIRSGEDPLLAIEYHRHFTHSLFIVPLGGLVAVLPWLATARFRAQWLVVWACAALAYLSHCLLDAATTYGTQLLRPFSDARFGWDLISIVDPVFTLALLVGLVIGLVRSKPRIVAASLTFCAAYLVLGGMQQFRAAQAQGELAASRGHRIERRQVMPTLANNIVWRTLYLRDGRIYSDRVRVGWFSSPTTLIGSSLPMVTVEDLTEVEVQGNGKRRSFERFAWFSNGWVARSPGDETVLGDMRYSLSLDAFDPIWGIRLGGAGATNGVEWVSRTRDRKLELSRLWQEITGRHPGYVAVSGRVRE